MAARREARFFEEGGNDSSSWEERPRGLVVGGGVLVSARWFRGREDLELCADVSKSFWDCDDGGLMPIVL